MDCFSLLLVLFYKHMPCLWLTDKKKKSVYECVYVCVWVCVVYHSKMCSYAVVSRALEQAPVNHTYNAKCVYFCTYLPQKCLVFNTII